MTKANSNDIVRTLIVWEIPAVGSPAFVEMYMNPESISIDDNKIQNLVQTKGGFIWQYWGENVTSISFNGKTGTGGIEALNVLHDIYRSEQLAMQKIISERGAATKRRQSLAQLASSVIMWYQGQGFRGFFTSFKYTETPTGMIDYSASFTAVEVIGERKNFLPWHRKPWSTVDNPSIADGKGSTTGGGYGTNYKIGEMNAPVVNETTGLASDPQFTSTTKVEPNQQVLLENLQDNNPSNLFARKL